MHLFNTNSGLLDDLPVLNNEEVDQGIYQHDDGGVKLKLFVALFVVIPNENGKKKKM